MWGHNDLWLGKIERLWSVNNRCRHWLGLVQLSIHWNISFIATSIAMIVLRLRIILWLILFISVSSSLRLIILRLCFISVSSSLRLIVWPVSCGMVGLMWLVYWSVAGVLVFIYFIGSDVLIGIIFRARARYFLQILIVTGQGSST